MTKTATDMPSLLSVIIPIVTFVLGFLASRFTMSKGERKTHQMRMQEFSNRLIETRIQRYTEYTDALQAYLNAGNNPSLEDFCELARKGEAYIATHTSIADAINSGTLPEEATKNTHTPEIIQLVDRVLPTFFDTLQDIAKKRGIAYQGNLNPEHYASIYKVYNDYMKNQR